MMFRLLLALLSLTGCAELPERAVAPEPALPQAWRNATVSDLSQQSPEASRAYWQRYGSEGLVAYVADTLSRNRDFAASLARLNAARASLKIESAGLLPQLDLTADLSARDNSLIEDDNPQASFGLGFNYEVDLWRRNAARRLAADERVSVSEYDRRALGLALSGQTAQTYVRVLGLKARAAIARENLEANQQVLRLLELRFAEGAIPRLDVEQQRSAVSSVVAGLAALERDARLNDQSLAVLVADPERVFPEDTLMALKRPEAVVLPPERLLSTRPDILSAEAGVAALTGDVTVARAALLPQLNLSTLQSFAFNPASTIASMAAAIAQPIFRGGALTGAVERSEVALQEQLERYVQTTLIAWREVEDALASLQAARLRESALSEASVAARKAYELARVRYEAGAENFLTVLTTQTARLQTEDALVQASQDVLLADIALGLAQALPAVGL